MAVTYSLTVINYRLQGVIDALDFNGNSYLYLREGTTVLSTIQLSRPCGSVDGGVLTFLGTLLDPAATATGFADNGIIKDATGELMISDLSVGIPLDDADIIISNGLNSTLITAGQTIEVLSAQITGS